MRSQQRDAQSAVDSAALAGAIELTYSTLNNDIYKAAQLDSISNGFVPDGKKVVLTAHKSPLTGPSAGSPNSVEAILTVNLPMFFSVTGVLNRPISVRSVASIAATRACVYATSPTGTGITVSNSTVATPQCNIASSAGFAANNSVITSPQISAAGTINSSSTTYGAASPSSGPPVGDPCAALPTCNYFRVTPPATNNCTAYALHLVNQITTLYPGTYCDGIKFNNSDVTFAPGLYIFPGSSAFGFSSNNSVLHGTGVTFYFDTETPKWQNTVVNFAAPTSGPMNGVLFYNTPGVTGNVSYSGAPGSNLSGGIFAPAGTVNISGSVTSPLLVVGASVNITNANITAPDNSFPNNKHAAITE